MQEDGEEGPAETSVEDEFPGLFSSSPDMDDVDEDKYVYVNGKLVRQSTLKQGEQDLEDK